jgi:hypothetical protein
MDFVDAALAEMQKSKGDCNNQVGSEYNGVENTVGKEKINCILFVKKVLEFAFTASDQGALSRGVERHYPDGGELAKYLVETAAWKAYYWNPDVRHPSDGDDEHPASYQDAKTRGYYAYDDINAHPDRKIPISGFIVNFRPTPIVNGSATSKETDKLQWFKTNKFAYGIARGGYHTFLVTRGKLWEVHWDKIGPSLYQISDFENFAFKSGAVVIPNELVQLT